MPPVGAWRVQWSKLRPNLCAAVKVLHVRLRIHRSKFYTTIYFVPQVGSSSRSLLRLPLLGAGWFANFLAIFCSDADDKPEISSYPQPIGVKRALA